MPSPPLVTLTFWGVPTPMVPAAFARMALDRPHLHRLRSRGLRFAKLLGTGNGRTFTIRDADPRHWGLLAVWDDARAAAGLEHGPTARAWERLADERLVVRMEPVSSRGLWSRRQPFGDPVPRPTAGPVASITRARLRWRTAPAFWRAVPPVSTDLWQAPGVRLAVGIGEAPVGLQGTFSLWEDTAALVDFAHRRTPHRDVIARTATEGWYAEELFARFRVLAVEGTFAGRAP